MWDTWQELQATLQGRGDPITDHHADTYKDLKGWNDCLEYPGRKQDVPVLGLLLRNAARHYVINKVFINI